MNDLPSDCTKLTLEQGLEAFQKVGKELGII